MAVGFDGIAFSVYPDGDGFVPLPVGPDNDNQPRSYSCDVRMNDGTDVSDLRAKRCRVTISPMMGVSAGGSIVIEGPGVDGTGVASLVYPTSETAELTVDAILVYVSPTTQYFSDEYRVSLRFLLVE